MGANPEPVETLGFWQTQRPIVQPHTDAERLATRQGLQLQGRMRRVGLEQLEVLPGEDLNICGQRIETSPEALRSGVLHSARVAPPER